MSKQVQIRRGTTAENAAFTGVDGEVTYDTQAKRLITHDGVTLGGTLQSKLTEVELNANKDTDVTLAANSDVKYPSQKAVKTYADTKQTALGYTAENSANKDTDGTLAANSDVKYPSQKAVKTYADLKVLKAGDTMTGTLTITPAANTSALSVSGLSLTAANAQSVLDLAGTWNTSGTPTAVKLNITDTASNAASLLLDLQVAGVSKFAVTKTGTVGLPNVTGALFNLAETNTSWGFSLGSPTVVKTGTVIAQFNNAGLTVVGSLTFDNGIGAGVGVILSRDAANILALRNTTNAQTFNVYNTFTDASNYERGFVRWSGNVFQIGVQIAGTGTTRALAFLTNNVTRWNVDTSGNFVAAVDDLFDVGAIGATRPRHGYFSKYLHWGGQSRVTADFAVINSATLANITGLTVTVAAGLTYEFRAKIHLTADTVGGVKLAMGGTATATAIRYQIEVISNTSNALAVSATQNALGGASGVAADTSYYAEITGIITVNVGGTLTVQLAENTAVAATAATALRGSMFQVNEF